MSYWLAIDLGIEQCLSCNTVYHVKARDLTRRSTGQFICSCGREINSWRGHRTFSYQSVSTLQQERREQSAVALKFNSHF